MVWKDTTSSLVLPVLVESYLSDESPDKISFYEQLKRNDIWTLITDLLAYQPDEETSLTQAQLDALEKVNSIINTRINPED